MIKNFFDKAFQVRYKFAGENFEVLVDFNKLNEFKKKPNEISVYDVLADRKIFRDQKKGEIASENLLMDIFKLSSKEEILKIILLKGECQIPTEFLNKLRNEKKLQVINYIAENAINPQTKGKYTQTMIQSEVNNLKYNFKANIDFIIQAEEVLRQLKKVVPISLEKVILELKVPAEFCGNFYGKFRKYGRITKEFFDKEGNLRLHIEVMESILDTIIEYIKRNSNNSAEYHIVKINK